jgi:acyl-CoA dehydrogenase
MTDLSELRDKTAEFVRTVVIPAEDELGLGHPSPELRARLQHAARAAGLLSPHAPVEHGGLGLTLSEQAVIFEEAGYSLLGPLALNCAAPDEGNMHLLSVVATEIQQTRYLRPLVAGEIRSSFAMTEPAPGAGSDPSCLQTTALPDGDGWRISGHKRLITGANGAAFAICMARTSVEADGPRATMFLVDAENPGFSVTGAPDTLDHAMIGGHCDVTFDDCFVPADGVLGAPHEGFRYARVRLAPARLTHCMRWLGLARRSLDIALDVTAERSLFGSRLHDLGLAQGLIADSVIELETSRAVIRWACEAIEAGANGTHESSVAKVHVSEAVFKIVDRSMQLAGGSGVTHELPLARFSNEVRAFRIYDGPSEAHRWAIARRASRRRAAERA